MQFSPKLKKAMEEIKAILKRHDIAGMVVLHTPGHSEYLNHISPTYSCAKQEGDMIRFRAKKADFNNSAELRDQCIADTANMFNLISDVGAQNILGLLKVSEQFDKAIDAEHRDGPSGHTSHTTQNN
jgi:hypothetical protein